MFVILDKEKIIKNGRYQDYLDWFHEGMSFNTIFLRLDNGDSSTIRVEYRGIKSYEINLRSADLSPFSPKPLKDWL